MENHELILATLLEVKKDLGRIEQKVDGVIADVPAQIRALQTDVSSLKDFRTTVKAKVTTISAITSMVIGFLVWLGDKLFFSQH